MSSISGFKGVKNKCSKCTLLLLSSLKPTKKRVSDPYSPSLEDRFKGFYLNLFMVPSPILSLKSLNKYPQFPTFCMESVKSVISSLRLVTCLTSVGIQDAYLRILMYPSHQCILRFAVGDTHFRVVALTSGLSFAPRVFTKVLAPLLALLRTKGIRVSGYVDNLSYEALI